LPGNSPTARPAPEPTTRNIEIIAALEREALHHRSALDRLSDAVTSAAGSAAFIIAHAGFFTVWITLNLTGKATFDPYPFNFLVLMVSLEAIFLTSIVLMTQNRMTRQADKRAHLDLQVNLLAEQELTTMLKLLTAIGQRLDVTVDGPDKSVEQLVKDTDIHTIAVALEKELTATDEPSSAPVPHTPSPRRS
jgi:uncharacterized membrane protein